MAPRSYLDSVVGNGTNTAPFLVANQEDSEEEEEDIVENDDPTCPTIRLSAKEKNRICEPWRQTLIIKVMGRRVGYAYLLRRLNTMWRPKGRMELIALDNDYFLVKFGMQDDLEFAKYEGPWMILDHYLIVKEWVPNFDPMTDTTEKVLVWVRFPSLPVEYYNLLCLRKIGNKLQRTIRVDHTTSLVSKGKFARVCVEIDISKPLVSRFTLEDRVWHVAYEGMHLVCFSCGLYGYRQESCSTCPKETATADEVPLVTLQGGDPGVDKQIRGSGPQGHTRTAIQGAKPYGSWMIVTRKDKRNQGRAPGQGKQVEVSAHKGKQGQPTGTSLGNGSRYALLGDELAQEVPGAMDHESNPMATEKEDGSTTGVSSQGARANSHGGKNRRANVIANEKQILNDAPRFRPAPLQGNEVAQGERVTGSTSRRAAEEEEHVVIRGEQGGKHISSTTVHNGDSSGAAIPVEALPATEHHGDPLGDFDNEGDVIMEIERHQTAPVEHGDSARNAS
ncbi:uncharacterized protein LOC116033116 [Ipomoea triloba]|uniref:uncharacterized protein LOC116033116 n=1 Tax=Ipomoea triloba TaxID=35885 RepID=UPI00125DD174|nr:uncharacterized protein LOC116033116 [Ipomoea triloba]